ncbi:vWA domain-containing protein [Fredinandcohnia humi]
MMVTRLPKKIMLQVCIVFCFIYTVPIHTSATSNNNSSSPTLDAGITPDKNAVELSDNGLAEVEMKINLLPSGKATAKPRDPNDVVFVFDKSGSMNDIVHYGNGRETTKLEKAKEAVTLATEIFKENNKGPDKDQYALVPFSWQNDMINSIDELKNNPYLVSNMVNQRKFTAEGGTNYTQALQKAGEILRTSTKDRNKYIIFLTDGMPTNSENIQTIKGYYYKLINYDEYRSIYGYRDDYNTRREWFALVIDRGITGPDGTIYIEWEERYISGQVPIVFDSNSGRNQAFIKHNDSFYLYEPSFADTNSIIKSHIREVVDQLKKENVSLYNIGFGDEKNIDMNFLVELASRTNGTAIQVDAGTITEVFERIASNLSSEYPSLTEGFLRFTLPENVQMVEDEHSTVVGNEVIYSLPDIPFTPTPPASMFEQFNVKFTSKGIYNFRFDIVYNGGKIKIENIPVTVTVNEKNRPLQKIEFSVPTKTIYVGESFNLNDLLRFIPFNATNKEFNVQLSQDSTAVSAAKAMNGKWIITGAEKGYRTITVTSLENSRITASILVIVKERNSDGEGEDHGLDNKW